MQNLPHDCHFSPAIKSIIRKVAEMEQDLEHLRADLVAERRRNQSPPVTRVKEKDVLAELNRLRDVLLSDVGTAAPVLKALVGDVVIEARAVEGQAKPQMVARFTIDAVPAIAALRRGKAVGANGSTADLWEFLNADRWIMLGKVPRGRRNVVVSLHDDRRAAAKRLRNSLRNPAWLRNHRARSQSGRTSLWLATAVG